MSEAIQVLEDNTDPNCVYIGSAPAEATADENKWEVFRKKTVGKFASTQPAFSQDGRFTLVTWTGRATHLYKGVQI